MIDPQSPRQHEGLDESTVDPNPIRQFQVWFEGAINAHPSLPNAMTVATATRDGKPSARIVLLKEFDERGFTFYTNYRSQKGKELDQNPRASLLFYWSELDRQVRIDGTVEKLSHEESAAYFRTRPRESQIGGVASPQSQRVQSRAELEKLFTDVAARFAGQSIPCPQDWGGYRVKPTRIEFWQNRPARLHDRIVYELNADGRWTISRLAP
jgi:pyridoxamine 5'-phosphate oxidase